MVNDIFGSFLNSCSMLYCVTLYQTMLGATTDNEHLTEHNIQLSALFQRV